MNSIPHKPAKPAVETPGPRRPEPTWQEVVDIADHLLAQDRAQLSRLSHAGRLRRWGRK